MKVVLFEPQIPQNTGNIVRTCSAVGAELFLVRPLGFHVTDRWLKRAGLDYWGGVTVTIIDDLPHLLKNTFDRFFFYSSHAKSNYTEIEYKKNDAFIFGSETSGLPEKFWKEWPELFYTIPKKKETRCLNLANAVSIVLYEAWRQTGFKAI